MRSIKHKKIDISIGNAKSIIHYPVITEKSTKVSEYGQFIFQVDMKANTKEIKIAIEKLFKVKVLKVGPLNNNAKLLFNIDP